jgi:hypothetical protein
MSDNEALSLSDRPRTPWNKGKVIILNLTGVLIRIGFAQARASTFPASGGGHKPSAGAYNTNSWARQCTNERGSACREDTYCGSTRPFRYRLGIDDTRATERCIVNAWKWTSHTSATRRI